MSGFWYLATVYSAHEDGLGVASIEAADYAARLLRAGVNVYSPIVHCHQIAIVGGIDPLDHEFWLKADQSFMDAAHGLLVVKMAGWQLSKGIHRELNVFALSGKPIAFWNPIDPIPEGLK